MGAIASQITSLTFVFTAFYSGVDITRKMYPSDDVIIIAKVIYTGYCQMYLIRLRAIEKYP